MITLRLDKNGGINKGDIKAFEHDNKSETYIIQLYKNNAIYDLTNKTVELTIVEKKRKYGDMMLLPIESSIEGKVKLEILSSITKLDGTYDFKLTVKDTAGLVETFPNFQVKIDTDITKNIAGDIVEDKNFTILSEGLKSLSEYDIYKNNAKKVPEIEQNIENLGSQLDNITNKTIVTVDDFGAKGDSITDDSVSLQNAFNWSKSNKKAIYLLDKRYYTTQTLNVGGSIIRSINDIAGDADPYFLKKPNGDYAKGVPYWNYYYNIDTTYTWRSMIDETSYGACIISDKDIPILQADTGEMFNIEGIGIVGNHRMKNQIGLYCPTPTEYKGNKQHFKNINVAGCGNNGIHLERGLEVSVIENVKSRYNNGHGLYTGFTSGIDSATEYLKFKDCAFNTNRLDGIHFKYWRKSISFDNVDLGGNGQYQINSIDSLLGYDRTIPNITEDMRAGIYFEDGNLEQSGIALDLGIKNCWGEMVAKAVHLSATSGAGAINNLNFDNNSFLRVNTITSLNNENGCVYYIDVKYARDWSIKGTNNHALDMFKFKNIPTNGGNINIIDTLPDNIVSSSFYLRSINQPFKSNDYIIAEKRIFGNQTIIKDLQGTGNSITIDNIKLDFTKTTANNTSNSIAFYSLTAHWGANNSDKLGGYLLIVTRMPSGNYMMLNVAMDSVDGFTTAPSLNSNGILSIESVNYYRYTLTRVDNNKTN